MHMCTVSNSMNRRRIQELQEFMVAKQTRAGVQVSARSTPSVEELERPTEQNKTNQPQCTAPHKKYRVSNIPPLAPTDKNKE